MSDFVDTEIGEIPSDWSIQHIEDLILDKGISVGVMYPGKHDFEGIPLIKAGDVREGYINPNIDFFISEEVNQKYKRTILEGGELLVVLVGDPGLSAVVPSSMKGWNAARAIGVLKLIDQEEGQFISFALRSRNVKHVLKSFCNTTVQATLNLKELKQVPIPWPKKEEREQIKRLLIGISNKIATIEEQNQTLEELAQTLFKRWFVEFEFPNENGQPYKSSGGKMIESELGEIPEGWELHPMEDLVKVHNGYSYKGSELQESNVAMVTLKNFDRNGGFRFDGFKELVSDRYKEKHIVDVGDLIVAHTDLTQDAEVLGNPALIMKNEKYTKLVVSMDLVKVESKHKSLNTEFLYYLMRDKRFKYHCKGYANGTTVLHLSKSAIPEYLFPFPKDMTLIEEFGAYAYSVYQKISNNIDEIQSLTKLRDTLLPKLMSGELRVKE